MDDNSPLRPAPPSLVAAMRRARIEDAERSDARAELRGAEIARLEMLQTSIVPVIQQVPEDADIFDVGLSMGEHPRLFIDMIAYVEMARDKRVYRFIQNMRHGSIVIAETDSIDKMAEAVADYVARRLIEREKAIASDSLFFPRQSQSPIPPKKEPVEAKARWKRIALDVMDLAESAVLILIVAAVVWFLWRLALAWRAGAF